MGLSMLLFAELFCFPTAVLNYEKQWLDVDKQHLYRAAYVCYTRYAPKNPCLRAFIKQEPLTYRAICGREE